MLRVDDLDELVEAGQPGVVGAQRAQPDGGPTSPRSPWPPLRWTADDPGPVAVLTSDVATSAGWPDTLTPT